MKKLMLTDDHGRSLTRTRYTWLRARDWLFLLFLWGVTGSLFMTGHWFLALFPGAFGLFMTYVQRLVSRARKAQDLIQEGNPTDAEILLLPVLGSVLDEHAQYLMLSIYSQRGLVNPALKCAKALENSDSTMKKAAAAVCQAKYGDIETAKTLLLLLEDAPATKGLTLTRTRCQSWFAFRANDRSLFPHDADVDNEIWIQAALSAWGADDVDLVRYHEDRPDYAEKAYPELTAWIEEKIAIAETSDPSDP